MRYSPSTRSFYPADIVYATLPSDVIDIDRAQFDLAMQCPADATFAVVDGQVIIHKAPLPSDDQLLLAAITAAIAVIDAAAGDARSRYLTDIAGQASVYQAKSEQARAVLASSAAIAPYITAEALALGQPIAVVAARIAALADAWEYQNGPAIEGVRIAAKAAVKAAQTPEAVRSIAEQAMATLAGH